jgi:N6-adenosine-specific RNA methylase IME4
VERAPVVASEVEQVGCGASHRLPSIVTDLNELVAAGARFSTIYADPPWEYGNKAARGAASKHYGTMTLDEICQLPIDQLIADHAHLHLWVTTPLLPIAFSVIEAWGFSYRSCFVWVKPQLGLGNYWRVSQEFLLFASKGSLPFLDNSQRSWLITRRRRHSEKPFAVREIIEKVSPGPYLELFGRREYPNSDWTVFGNQVERMLF